MKPLWIILLAAVVGCTWPYPTSPAHSCNVFAPSPHRGVALDPGQMACISTEPQGDFLEVHLLGDPASASITVRTWRVFGRIIQIAFDRYDAAHLPSTRIPTYVLIVVLCIVLLMVGAPVLLWLASPIVGALAVVQFFGTLADLHRIEVDALLAQRPKPIDSDDDHVPTNVLRSRQRDLEEDLIQASEGDPDPEPCAGELEYDGFEKHMDAHLLDMSATIGGMDAAAHLRFRHGEGMLSGTRG